MSAICFHSIYGDQVEVRGAERAHFLLCCADMAWFSVERIAQEYGSKPSMLRSVFPKGHYVFSGRHFASNLMTFFRCASGDFMLDGESLDVFDLILNTAFYMGSDPVKLGARLHGQCELHAYVEGPNRRWLSDIIKQGRRFKFFRDGMGWEAVIELLDSEDDSFPVVTSYSGSDAFPSYRYADGFAMYPDGADKDEQTRWSEEHEAWEQRPYEDRFQECVLNLRKAQIGLELEPDGWNDFYFGHGVDANQLVSRLYEMNSLIPDVMVRGGGDG